MKAWHIIKYLIWVYFCWKANNLDLITPTSFKIIMKTPFEVALFSSSAGQELSMHECMCVYRIRMWGNCKLRFLGWTSAVISLASSEKCIPTLNLKETRKMELHKARSYMIIIFLPQSSVTDATTLKKWPVLNMQIFILQ